MLDSSAVTDQVTATAAYRRPTEDETRIRGLVTVAVYGPNGELKSREVTSNLVTQVGDQIYGERGGGVSGAPAAPTGMRYGTGTTAAAKTGAGAAIVTYVTGSNKAFDATYPQSSLSGSSRRITYQCTWPAGTATASAIAEVVVTNESPLSDVAGTAANTMARALLSSTVNKASTDSLVVTWTHDLLGA